MESVQIWHYNDWSGGIEECRSTQVRTTAGKRTKTSHFRHSTTCRGPKIRRLPSSRFLLTFMSVFNVIFLVLPDFGTRGGPCRQQQAPRRSQYRHIYAGLWSERRQSRSFAQLGSPRSIYTHWGSYASLNNASLLEFGGAVSH